MCVYQKLLAPYFSCWNISSIGTCVYYYLYREWARPVPMCIKLYTAYIYRYTGGVDFWGERRYANEYKFLWFYSFYMENLSLFNLLGFICGGKRIYLYAIVDFSIFWVILGTVAASIYPPTIFQPYINYFIIG